MSEDRRASSGTPRISVLLARDRSYSSFAAFQDGIRELGYVEGQTVTMEARFAAGRLPGLAAELVALQVDLIAEIGAVTFWAARQATSDISIVFTIVLDPVAAGMISNADRPSGNTTGFTNFNLGQARNQIQILRKPSPDSRVWRSWVMRACRTRCRT
jgi:putative tryptophan/tyrosine transport system substrate-binding protein